MSFEKAVKAKPKARDKGTLFYMRIITMNNLPLQPLVWKDLDEDPMLAPVSISESPLHHYVVLKDGDGIKVRYSKKGADFDYATGFATIDEAKAWAWKHYNEKMQLYVKPMPTWIDVDDMLPEMYKRVLIKADCYLVAGREPKSEHNKDWGISGDWMWSIVSDSWVDSHMVTHWMPIPEFSTMKNLHKGGDCE